MLRVPGTNLDLVLFNCFYLRAFWFVMGKSLANLMSIRCTPQGMEMSLTQSEDVRAAEIPLGSSSITVVPPLAPPAPLPAAEAVPTEELQGPGPSVDPKVSSPKHTSAQDSSPLPLPHVFSGSKLFLVKGMRSPERYVPPHMRARTQPTEVCSSAPAVVRVGRGFPPQCHVDFGFNFSCFASQTKEPDASPKRQGCPQLEEPMPRHAHLPFGAVVAGPCTLLSAKEESQASTPEKEKSKEPSQPTFKLLLRPKPPPPTEQVFCSLEFMHPDVQYIAVY